MPRAAKFPPAGLMLRAEVPVVLLLLMLFVLVFAGGASRAEVGGQVLVAVAVPLVVVAALLAGIPARIGGLRGPVVILGASAAIVALQLVPLPPGLWASLPGRQAFSDLPVLLGAPAPWRPVALVPDAALLSLSSLLIPAACLYLVAALPPRRMRAVLLALVAAALASAVLGVLQVSSTGWENPLVNATPGEPSGIFANRNHQALFLSIGIVLVTTTLLVGRRLTVIELAAAMLMIALLVLSILSTGSRAGLLLGAGALIASGVLVAGSFRLRRASVSRRAIGGMAAGAGALLVLLGLLSVVMGRARSVNRLIELDAASDFRARAIGTVTAMTREYFPVGSGFGSFDPVFRMHEPTDLLKLTYFNHAHNDFLEVALEGGLPAIAVTAAALFWAAIAAYRSWRRPFDAAGIVARSASIVLLLVLCASTVDYPARTPMMMALIAIASAWLAAPDRWWGKSALR